jgi:glycerophosphoryl diester phosphodiesterase
MRLLRADGQLIRVGHRGAARLAPENTVRSFEVAVEHGVDAIEFDVLDAGPGPLVLGHSLAELGPDPDTLDDALDFLAGSDVVVHVDLKLTTRLDEVAAALDRHGVAGRAVVSSFHLPSLQAIAAHAPQLPIGFTYPEDRYGVSKRRGMKPAIRLGTLALRRAIVARIPAMIARAGARALMLQHAVVSPAAVARAHAAGAAVWAWTVDDLDELSRLDAAGVDAVITNDPRLFAQGMESAKADPIPREDA